jgi:hypothetical protein
MIRFRWDEAELFKIDSQRGKLLSHRLKAVVSRTSTAASSGLVDACYDVARRSGLSLNRGRNAILLFLHAENDGSNIVHGAAHLFNMIPHGLDNPVDGRGGKRRGIGKFFHFVGDHHEAGTYVARMSGFNSGV